MLLEDRIQWGDGNVFPKKSRFAAANDPRFGDILD